MISELSILRRNSIQINESMDFKIPTLAEIDELGETVYNEYLFYFASTNESFMVQLWDAGYDYETFSNYDIFIRLIGECVDQETGIIGGMALKALSWWFNLDPNECQLLYAYNNDSKMNVIVDEYQGFYIDKLIYDQISHLVKMVNGVSNVPKYNFASRATKEYTIAQEKRTLERELRRQKARTKGFIKVSTLTDLATSLVSSTSYTYEKIWDMTIYQAHDLLKKVGQRDHYKANIIGIYTGNIDPKKQKLDLNWIQNIRKSDATSSNVIETSGK